MIGQQHRVLAVEPEHLENVAAAAAEHEDVTEERVFGKFGLHQRGETVEALPHVGVAGNDPDPCVGRQADRARLRRAVRTMRRLASSTAPRKRTRAPPISMSMAPLAGRIGGDEGVHGLSVGVASMDTGSSTAARLAGAALTPYAIAFWCLPLQPKSRFALMPSSMAMAATDTPGSTLRAISSFLISALCSRRRRGGALATGLSKMRIGSSMHAIASALDHVMLLIWTALRNRALRLRL